ncbi:hypothetical protein BDB00DRAFT_495753 [Zychaea mexicana]|uniref:uncharacterized protein n=1 Tax=Zychaea mexicana TaxID=64656 RepID=UPI0022FED25C|nr:uncharacterized protein BDB00DRAFT_495753 [Zychaea mexicana]KAI9498035.1 hypothetical protein BDB00DRAFT_495753 [Zychaea mexicana]
MFRYLKKEGGGGKKWMGKIRGEESCSICYSCCLSNSISEQDGRLESPTALGRIRFWETLEKSDIVKLLATATGMKEDSECKLRVANEELEKTKVKLSITEDEKSFFEKKFNKLKDKLYAAQKSKFRASHNNTSRVHSEAGPSSARGSSSSRAADTTAKRKEAVPPTVDSDESTDDELPINSRTVPNKRTHSESSHRNHNERIPPYANPAYRRSAAHFKLPTNSHNKHSNDLLIRDKAARKRRRSETDESDVDDSIQNDGSHDSGTARILDLNNDDDELNGNDSFDDAEIIMSSNRGIRKRNATCALSLSITSGH